MDGRVIHAEIDDLDADGFLEVLVYTQSAGSYGGVIGYSTIKGASVVPIGFPPFGDKDPVAAGYMGHDKFMIREHRLVREFPVYRAEETNSQPTCSMRQVVYGLDKSEAGRVCSSPG